MNLREILSSFRFSRTIARPLPLGIFLFVTSLSLILTHHQDSNPSNGGADSSTAPVAATSIGDDNGQLTRQQIEFRANEALELIHDWTLRFGGEVYRGTQETTCHRAIRDQFDPGLNEPRRGGYRPSVVSIDWTRLHGDIVRTISNSMSWHKGAVEAIVRASEAFAGNHSHDEKLRVDYVDVHRLYDIDELVEDEDQLVDGNASGGGSIGLGPPSNYPNETLDGPSDGDLALESGQLDASGRFIANDATTELAPEPLATPAPLVYQAPGSPLPEAPGEGEWQTPIKYLKLSKHPNFGDVPISSEQSAVHVPVHIYPADPIVMNSIAWSEQLTKVFKNNFVRNPKLTNQYFASPLGFMRLFPAQKWQIPRTDPDLYDARMRPWYVAGASSRKDVVILIDSSGSMTGSKRDIAKGVIYEILDTLTDNDHFLILKFSDVIQQVGVPSCPKMRVERRRSQIPLKNTMFQPGQLTPMSSDPSQSQSQSQGGGSGGSADSQAGNGTDIDSLYLLPATVRNVRYVKSNFTIATSGIANFSNALVTAFEVLKKYQDTETLGSQCNQAIMLITDGSPSDFEDIFNRYNYPNAPIRVFTYMIGREVGDIGTKYTKMMACHNRGYYTHVINLAEVRETVQQYIPVMARPLVLNWTHPTTWTPAYGELTYQMLTDWIWESRRRERARAMLAGSASGGGGGGGGGSQPAPGTQLNYGSAGGGGGFRPDIQVTNDDVLAGGGGDSMSDGQGAGGEMSSLDSELEALDIFGYNQNPDCFWETRRNDLLTTVVQPVYDQRNETRLVEKFLNKNTWIKKESVARTANLLGIAAADMKINDIIALAPSHRLGANGYAIMLTNNGLIMHHPDLRSVLEPFTSEPSERNVRILKPFFSSLDLVQVEHILNSASQDSQFVAMRREAVEGKTGWRELLTKRTLDCQRRVQSRRQIFYYKPLDQFPFAFMIAIPQPYGSHRLEAQVEVKNSSLPERLTTYFTTSDYDLWSVHPDYQYCDGPSNNTITTLLDMFQRIEEGKLDDIQWRPAESSRPPVFSPDKIICDKSLIQALVYDAMATFSFSDNCGPPSVNAESSLVSMFGVRFSFVATRSGLTRVRHYNADDLTMKKEALAFAKKHARASDETYYSRTVDYNMLINDTAALIQVPFNAHLKIAERLRRYEHESHLAAASSYDADGVVGPDFRPSPMISIKDMNLFDKLAILTNSSIHVIATQSILANEGAQKAVAGVVGVFYDYAAFVMRLLNTTNGQFGGDQAARRLKKPAHCYLASSANDEACRESGPLQCGHSNDTIDCLLIDNNGYIVASEDLNFIGRHLRAYDSVLMARLVSLNVFHELNVTDYQSICMRQEEKATASSGSCRWSHLRLPGGGGGGLMSLGQNLIAVCAHLWAIATALLGLLADLAQAHHHHHQQQQQQQLPLQPPLWAMLPNKTYLRPCDRVLTRYETRPGAFSSDAPEYYTTSCQCPAWFVYEQVPRTNLLMLIVDSTPACQAKCKELEPAASSAAQSVDDSLNTQYNIIGATEQSACSMFEREASLYKRKLDTCISHHPEEDNIKLCGAGSPAAIQSKPLLAVASMGSLMVLLLIQTRHSFGSAPLMSA